MNKIKVTAKIQGSDAWITGHANSVYGGGTDSIIPEDDPERIEIIQTDTLMQCLKWKRIESKADLPEKSDPVFVCGKNKYGKSRTAKAIYIHKFSSVNEEDLPFTDGLDFCEKDGLHYNPEGWYEFNLENEINYEIEFEVTHFMPLPKFP